jgi:hypothetical protein
MTTFERITHPVGVQSVQRFRCRQLALTRPAVLLGGIMPERRLMPLAEPLDWLGHLLVAHDEGELIGVVRLNLGREGGLDYYADLLGAIGGTANGKRPPPSSRVSKWLRDRSTTRWRCA